MDDNEILNRLAVIEKKVNDNHRMLKGLRSRARLSTLITVVQWLLILGVIGYIWIFVQPYIQSIMETYQSLQSTMNQVNNIGSGTKIDINQFLDQIKQSLR